MKNKAISSVIFLAVLLVIAAAVLVGLGKSRRMTSDRWAAEGQAAVEGFLRDGASGAFSNRLGSFLRLEGSGFYNPVWNIQGYHYLTLQRTGYFSGGSLPVRIFVTQGGLTAPGLKTVGKPKIEEPISWNQDVRIFVSHPEVKP